MGAVSKVENARRMKLYKQGLNDAQIGLELGLNPSTISCWRRNKKLLSYCPRHKKMTKADILRLKELHAQGVIDSEIARKMERGVHTILKWRTALGLSPNYSSGHRPVIMQHQVAKAIIEISEILPEIKRVLVDVKREPESYKFKDRAHEYWETLAARLAFFVIKFPVLAQEMGYELDGMPELIRTKGRGKGHGSDGG